MTTTALTAHPALVREIYEGFARNHYLYENYITVAECAQALGEGYKRQGTTSLEEFLKRTIRKIDKPTARTHIGTFSYLKSVTEQKVEAALVAARQKYVAAAVAERTAFEQQLAPIQAELQTTQNQLALCQENAMLAEDNIRRLQAEEARINDRLTEFNNRFADLPLQLNQLQQTNLTRYQWMEEQQSALAERGQLIRSLNERLDQVQASFDDLEAQNRQARACHLKLVKIHQVVQKLLEAIPLAELQAV